VEAVLRRHLEHAETLRPLLQLATTVRERYAEMPGGEAQLAVGRARLRREAQAARRAAGTPVAADRRRERRATMRLRLVPTLVGVILAAVVFVSGATGLALAADDAAPGDLLYGVDRLMERIQERVTRDPEAVAQLRRAFAQERMEELEKLTERGDPVRLQEAMGEYGNAFRAAAEEPRSEGPPSEEEAPVPPVQQRNQAVEGQGEQAQERLEDQQSDENRPDDVGWWGGEAEVDHPVVDALVREYEDILFDTYGITETKVISWFVEDGYGLGQIMHALETLDRIATLVDDGNPDNDPADECRLLTVEEIIARSSDHFGDWREMWQACGLTPQGDPGPPVRVTPPKGDEPPGADEVDPPGKGRPSD